MVWRSAARPSMWICARRRRARRSASPRSPSRGYARADVHGALRGQAGRHRHGVDAARRGVQTGESRASRTTICCSTPPASPSGSGRRRRSDAAGLSPAAPISSGFRSSSCACWPRLRPSRRRFCPRSAGAAAAVDGGRRSVAARYDVFVSYRHDPVDRAFATELVAALEADGYRVAIDERDFPANASFLQEMERCIRESRFTVAVISPRYLESGNAQEEAIICKVLDMGDRKRRLIPLVIEAGRDARLAVRHRRHRLHEARSARRIRSTSSRRRSARRWRDVRAFPLDAGRDDRRIRA